MPTRKLRIQPSRVNRAYISGPLYHYHRITDEQLSSMGVRQMPGPLAGNVIRADGVTARRLRDGTMNVIVESTAKILRDAAFEEFMWVLRDPLTHGSFETIPADIDVEEVDIDLSEALPGIGGAWQWDIANDLVTLSPSALAMLKAVEPTTPQHGTVVAYLKLCGNDATRVEAGLYSAIIGETEFDMEFTFGSTRVRSAGTVIRDQAGTAAKMVGVVTDLSRRAHHAFSDTMV